MVIDTSAIFAAGEPDSGVYRNAIIAALYG
jgi:hypothetical protein